MFVLYVFLDNSKVKGEPLRFKSVDDCVYFAKKLHGQGSKITAYCLPETVNSDAKVY